MSKFLSIISGIITEVAGLAVSAGAGSVGSIPQLDSAGRLDISMMPVGLGSDTYTSTAAESLLAGAYVYITPTGTIANASAASGGNTASGFVLLASAALAPATVYFEGRNTAVTSRTIGAIQYLSDTIAGGVVEVAPVGVGKKYQRVGRAVSATSIDTEISYHINLIA